MNDRKKKIRRLRLFSMTAVVLAVTIGMIAGTGAGTLSSFGLKKIYAICPLGYLETALAGRDIMPHLLIFLVVIVLLTILLGRFFCGWICPVPLVRKLFSNKMDEPNDTFIKKEKFDGKQNDLHAPNMEEEHITKKMEEETTIPRLENSQIKKESSYGLPILIGVLASSAIFEFPVFCLICPIGLTFATIFALIRLFGFHEPTLDLIVFPAVILLELFVLKRWCSKFCPLGALLSLISRLNRRFLPTVDRSRCLEETGGVKCHQCRKACSFDIDIKDGNGSGHIYDCSRCKECAVNCPVHAIQFPWKRTEDTVSLSKKTGNS